MMFTTHSTFLCMALATSSIISALPSKQTHDACSNIKLPFIPDIHITITSIQVEKKLNYTVPATPSLTLEDVTGLNICEVLVTLTHPGAQDNELIQVWLPLNDWNGRFAAAEGSGWAAGLGDLGLAPLASHNYAAATTDAGLSGDPTSPAAWALTPEGEVNWELLKNFASRSVHDVAIVGKAVTAAYYGKSAKYSYWTGCSTGGRQGMVSAQRYPGDFDGLLVGSPAIYWPEYVVAEQWPQVVMGEVDVFPTNCELDFFTGSAIDACDELDGVKDQVITDLEQCHFDPFSLVGEKTQCDGKGVVIRRSVASVVSKIWNGPTTVSGTPLWYGLNRGAPLTYLASTTREHGKRTGVPFAVNDAWIRYFVKKEPDFDLSTIDSLELVRLFSKSTREYEAIIGSANPDLSDFKETGGKLLAWHGDADQLIFHQGTVRYRHEVESRMGCSDQVDEFFRLFIAPGVDHCGFGLTHGAVPTDPFGALIAWVEDDSPPDTLLAARDPVSGQIITRKICRYPFVAKYRGVGNPELEESYECQTAHY